jgi:molybdopterin molybdotransferase
MDGYAVRGNGPWILRPDIQVAGTNLAAPLRQGEAIRIGTGARVPAGSTTVIRDEYVTATTIVGKPGIAHRPGAPLRDDTRRLREIRGGVRRDPDRRTPRPRTRPSDLHRRRDPH